MNEKVKVESLIKQISEQEIKFSEHLSSMKKTYIEPEEFFLIPISAFFRKPFTLINSLLNRLVYLIK